MSKMIRSYLRKGEEIDYTYESSDSKSDPGTGASQGKRDDDGNTNAEQHFSGYVDMPGNQDVQGDETEDNAEPRREPESRLTRAGARREGIYVEDFPLSRYCHSSSRGRNKQN